MTKKMHLQQWIGPILFLMTILLPLPLDQKQQVFLGIFLWVVCQWLFTEIPLFATGIMGIALSVILGVTTAKEALAPFSDSLIFLFLGGFFLARSLEVLKLDKKIAMALLSLPFIRGKLSHTILAILCLTAFFSMWVSNTATTAMMLPIVLGLLKGLDIEEVEVKQVMMLATAYSATIGGVATPIGSPPNIIAIGMLKNLAGVDFSFLSWVMMAMPICLIMLYFVYKLTLSKIPLALLERPIKASINEEPPKNLTKQESQVLVLFGLIIFLWFSPSFISLVFGSDHSITLLIEQRLNPGIVALFIASLLFLFPLGEQEKILTQREAMKIDWATLLLFGAGLSLGQILFQTGLATLAGNSLIAFMGQSSMLLFIFCLILFTIFFTEIASNTATANILIPLIIATSLQASLPPLIPVLAVAISCNLAFMLPVATPPNAIVFGSGHVTLKSMVKMGFWLNLASLLVLTVLFTILYGVYR